jgi:response regulator RpfG family c-di-GMP phosphodiesterase
MGNYKKPSHLRQKMLENIPYLKPSLNIPNYHHERRDGSGYLQGLSQNDIPFTARIFQVILKICPGLYIYILFELFTSHLKFSSL